MHAGIHRRRARVTRRARLQRSLQRSFKGVELVRKHGLPASRRHSLQIEVNRKLYLDEDTREPNAGFARTRDDLSALIAHLAGFARAQTA